MSLARRALFLDRDGVINIDDGYTFERDKFVFVNGIFELAQTAVKLGYLVIVVTNQAGIGRGYYSEADFAKLTEWMCKEFADRGAAISDVYYCPYHPEFGLENYKKDSPDRKPNPGMILRAIEKYHLVVDQSVMIGDKDSDMDAAYRAGIKTRCLLRHPTRAREISAYATHEKSTLFECLALLQ
jgi:D-glycero-D-manno-heptose 1,7-bisphosphate phosphatase